MFMKWPSTCISFIVVSCTKMMHRRVEESMFCKFGAGDKEHDAFKAICIQKEALSEE